LQEIAGIANNSSNRKTSSLFVPNPPILFIKMRLDRTVGKALRGKK
jgi:hypothetical protein